MNVLHYLKRTGGAGFKGITPARWNDGSLFGSESQSGIGKGELCLSLFPRKFFIFIFPSYHQFLGNRVGNHMRETSSNDLFKLPG